MGAWYRAASARLRCIVRRYCLEEPWVKPALTPPTHVPWTGGVMGTATTYPRVTWTTDLEGAMTSSTGEGLVPWRAWESREQNLKRGVRAEDIP